MAIVRYSWVSVADPLLPDYSVPPTVTGRCRSTSWASSRSHWSSAASSAAPLAPAVTPAWGRRCRRCRRDCWCCSWRRWRDCSAPSWSGQTPASPSRNSSCPASGGWGIDCRWRWLSTWKWLSFVSMNPVRPAERYLLLHVVRRPNVQFSLL